MDQDSESIKITQTEEVLEAPKPQPDLKEPSNKKRKIIIWILSIFALLCAVAAGVFAYLYFTSSGTPETEVPEDTTIDVETPETTDEEVEITDTYIKRDLDEKIAVLYNTTQTSSPIIIKQGLHPEFVLFTKPLDNEIKTRRIIESLQSRTIYPDEIETISSEFGLNENQKGALNEFIDADAVAKKYQDVFGETLTHNSFNSNCPNYKYSKILNAYISIGGCGGTSPLNGYYYKTKYTKDNDHAYVYISAAVFNMEKGKLYCDLATMENWDTAETCGSSNSKDQYGVYYQLDENTLNPDSLGKYRFVFKKADNGTYYFEKVEKL